MSCLGLEFSLQFISFTNIEHFSSFGNLERLYSLLMTCKWHLNFMLFTEIYFDAWNGRFTQHITQLPQCHFLCCVSVMQSNLQLQNYLHTYIHLLKWILPLFRNNSYHSFNKIYNTYLGLSMWHHLGWPWFFVLAKLLPRPGAVDSHCGVNGLSLNSLHHLCPSSHKTLETASLFSPSIILCASVFEI